MVFTPAFGLVRAGFAPFRIVLGFSPSTYTSNEIARNRQMFGEPERDF
jgi:hypothetical protein